MESAAPHPGHPPQPGRSPHLLFQPFQTAAVACSRICLSCFSAVSTLGIQGLGGCQQPTSPFYMKDPPPAVQLSSLAFRDPAPVGSASSLGLCRKSVKRSIPENRSPAQSQAPYSLLRRALQTFGVAFRLSRARASKKFSFCTDSHVSTASAPLPSRGGPLDSGARIKSKGLPILRPRRSRPSFPTQNLELQ